MALVPIKTASETGYCDCICGCYELASLRDEDTGKGYCPACGKDHLERTGPFARIAPYDLVRLDVNGFDRCTRYRGTGLIESCSHQVPTDYLCLAMTAC